MQFGQEKELVVGHDTDLMVDGQCCYAPVNSYSFSFIYRVTGVVRACMGFGGGDLAGRRTGYLGSRHSF